MMVVVPGLAHGRDGGPGHVVGLNARALDPPRLRPPAMGQMADEPVAGDRGRDPGTDAPDHEAPAAQQIQTDRDRQLLQHPGPLQKTIEAIPSDPAQIEGRRMVELQPGVHLPDCIDRHRPPVGQIIVAVALALGPVAQIMGADHPERPAHAHGGPDPDQPVLQP